MWYVATGGNMTSNPMKGIRRKKSSLSEIKILVIGAPGVGKSGTYMTLIKNKSHIINVSFSQYSMPHNSLFLISDFTEEFLKGTLREISIVKFIN